MAAGKLEQRLASQDSQKRLNEKTRHRGDDKCKRPDFREFSNICHDALECHGR